MCASVSNDFHPNVGKRKFMGNSYESRLSERLHLASANSFPDDYAIVNHHANPSERAQVLQRIAVHNQHIGDFAGRERAQLVVEVADTRCVHGRRDDDLHRRHAGLAHQFDLGDRHPQVEHGVVAGIVCPQRDFAPGLYKATQIRDCAPVRLLPHALPQFERRGPVYVILHDARAKLIGQGVFDDMRDVVHVRIQRAFQIVY